MEGIFSKIAIDQVHEQNNDLIKNNDGATHLLNRANSVSLEKWEITTPELTRLISEFEDNFFINLNKSSAHHEDTLSFQKRFTTDVYKLYESMIYNPFQHKKLVKINNISMTYNADIDVSLRTLLPMGRKQHKDFLQKRLILGKVAIGVPIKKIISNSWYS